MAVTRGTRGCRLNPFVEFDTEEIKQAKFFQLEARGKIIKETNIDYEINLRELENTIFYYTDDQIKIKIIQQLYLSKVDIKPYTISIATDWLSEFVLHNSVIDIFKEAGLTGFSTKMIFNPKLGENNANCCMLFSNNIMPKAELDITTINYIQEEHGYYFRELGCLTYDIKVDDKIADFNRTAENWSSNYCPIWIVTAATKKIYDQNKLKGWAFRPVLEKGTILYKTYIQKWENIFQKVRCNE